MWKGYRDSLSWRKAMDLAESTYLALAGFPSDEHFGLISQMRRSAVPIPSNIAEGEGRKVHGAFANHLSIAYGSLTELETQIVLFTRPQYMPESTADSLRAKADELGRRLSGLQSLVNGRIPKPRHPVA